MVDEYSVTVGRIYKWLLMAIEMRIDDVLNRRAKKEQQRKDRDKAIDNEEKREKKRDSEVEKALSAA